MRKRVIKTSLIVLVLFLIVREFLPFDVSLYNKKSNWSSNVNGNSKISFNKGYVYTDEKCIDLAREKEISLFFIGLEFDYEEVEFSSPTITVEVSNSTSVGMLRFVPLYKYLNFSSSNAYTWRANACYRNGLYSIMGTGNIEISGTEKIFGLCSGKKAKSIIDQIVVDVLNEKIFEDVGKQFNSIVND